MQYSFFSAITKKVHLQSTKIESTLRTVSGIPAGLNTIIYCLYFTNYAGTCWQTCDCGLEH